MGNRKRKFPAEKVGKSKRKSPAAAPPWTELPLDLTANILRRLGDLDILHSAQMVCSTWWKVCQDPSMWRTINIANQERRFMHHCTAMYRGAVYLSQGQLTDLTIGYHIHDELLYVAHRSRGLRRLTIGFCRQLSRTTLTEAVKLLPELEELHLILSAIDINSDDIESIGLSCPRLKSFTLERPDLTCLESDYDEYEDEDEDEDEDDEVVGGGGEEEDAEVDEAMFEDDDEDDEVVGGGEEDDEAINKEAVAIARNMPNLQHLVLVANLLNNKGVEAILDGCRRLESLDLRRCLGVKEGELGRRCFEQIKNVRLPFDDYDCDWELSSSSCSGRMPSHRISHWFDEDDGYVSEADGYDYLGLRVE